jgi:hypothetical protein
MSQTIDLTPTWETAVWIYCQVLQNPKAADAAVIEAQNELLKLARYVDDIQLEKIDDESNGWLCYEVEEDCGNAS